MNQTNIATEELEEPKTGRTTAESGIITDSIDWDEVKKNSRKGLNYIGIGTTFVGVQLTKLGEYLKSV